MDLIRMHGHVVVAGPDTAASVTARNSERVVGLRFRPGTLPRLLGVPASELRDDRVSLSDVIPVSDSPLVDLAVALAAKAPRAETAPWSLPVLGHITHRLSAGAAVSEVAEAVNWSSRTLQRHCAAVYGYGPTTLRRILRFRRTIRLLDSGTPSAALAACAGYADQSHLHREVREFAGLPLSSLASGQSGSGANPPGNGTSTCGPSSEGTARPSSR